MKQTENLSASGDASCSASCPECRSVDGFWPADYVDNGVGMEKCSPAHCEACGWSEPTFDDFLNSLPNADVEASPPKKTLMKQKTDTASEGASCSAFCHPAEKCAITENGICDALRICKCSMSISMLGDGCSYCNPELGAELKWNSEADEYNQWCDLGQDEQHNLIAESIAILEKENPHTI